MDVLQLIGRSQLKHVETDEQVVQPAEDWTEILDSLALDTSPEVDVVPIEEPVSADLEQSDEAVIASTDEVSPEETEDIVSAFSQTNTVSIQEHATISNWDVQLSDSFGQGLDLPSPIQGVGPLVEGPDAIVEVLVDAKTPIDVEKQKLDVVGRTHQTRAPIYSGEDVGDISDKVIPDANSEGSDREIAMPSTVVTAAQQSTEPGKAINLAAALDSTLKSKDAPLKTTSNPSDISKKVGSEVQAVLSSEGAVTIPIVEGPKNFTQEPIYRPFDQAVPISVSQTQSGQLNLSSSFAPVAIRDQPVVLQVAQSIEAAETGTIELRLDPAELGKVRITMSARDGIMLAVVTVERPETLDLLRRNSDSLDTTFNEQGFGETVLDFQQFDQGDQNEEPDEQFFASDKPESFDTRHTGLILQQTSDGLDIRL